MMMKKELDKILHRHKGWRLNKKWGKRANLQGANLQGADSIYSFGPIGQDNRIGYAISHGEKIMFKLGCFWGTHEEAVQAVRAKYGENSTYEKNLDLAVEMLKC